MGAENYFLAYVIGGLYFGWVSEDSVREILSMMGF